jgi:hypothetical protein
MVPTESPQNADLVARHDARRRQRYMNDAMEDAESRARRERPGALNSGAAYVLRRTVPCGWCTADELCDACIAIDHAARLIVAMCPPLAPDETARVGERQ